MKRKASKLISIIFILSFMTAIFPGCKTVSDSPEEAVQIIIKDTHYEVIIDYGSGKSHSELGEELGEKILLAIPDYELILDSYLTELVGNWYHGCITRVNDIKPQINQKYIDEIEGIASNFSGSTENIIGDGKISVDECYILNLLPDVVRGTQCSAFGVYGDLSETGETMSARILDWYSGSENQIAKLQSVTTYINGDQSIYSIGYIGYVGIISGFNDDGVFAAILDSATGADYYSETKSSFTLDIRYALETYDSIESFGEYMTSPERSYAFSHLIYLCDADAAVVLENNISSIENGPFRDIRTSDSLLNDGIEWGIDNSVGCVNSFMLNGNFDNYTNKINNTRRWKNMKNEINSKDAPISLEELKEIACYYEDSLLTRQNPGDLYNNNTQQIIIFEPAYMNLEIFFRPKNGKTPDSPTFEKIEVKFK